MTRTAFGVLGAFLAASFFFGVQFRGHPSVVADHRGLHEAGADGVLAGRSSPEPAADHDGGVCQADIDLPLQVELEAAPIVSPGVPATALIRVLPRRTAERIELAVRPSHAVSLGGLPGRDAPPLGAGQEATFDLTATLEPGRSR